MNADHPTAGSKIPDSSQSYWIDSATPSSFPPLDENMDVDYAIVGAGITGITLAYLLAEKGHRVGLFEANQIIHGTTGNTTAKITVQHDLIYDELITNFGEDQARLYYKANNEAMKFIQRTAAELHIDCEWSEEDTYLYAQSTESANKLELERKAYEKLGIPGEMIQSIPLPIEVRAALKLSGQAQFHPVKFVNGLLDRFVKAGGKVYEHTRIDGKVEQGDRLKIWTMDGKQITCRHVIASSHYPFYDGSGFYFTRLHAERSYIIAVKPVTDYLGGMYLSVDEPKRSLRSVIINGEKMVLIGGETHKTGQGDATYEYYKKLEQFAEKTLGIQEIPYRWSAQDWLTLDKVPYIGPITANHSNVWVATGYKKWGMTTGIAAALLLKDQLLGEENPYTELYTPSRFKADPGIKNLIVENFDVAKHLIGGKLESVSRKVDTLGLDEGSVVLFNGKRAGAYRDASGELHLVDTTCTHMGCEVEWNNGERTWDCPCHGSRFDYNGKVIEGPALQSLLTINHDE
ncbi:Glycine/D-amino acid oxidase [Paenibacillus sp. 1_12]|uniref:FAD-dependent oxidoreductase n=1 Tax=Paenibacillus sp. 1_12 TaxID=1566278 RepID=UPI0008E45DB7|nr:FAD-dependent oxidoreductase [Paenibacillus sp. 1_12]SFL75411.1 Glycine/D-amino acid oxidase [Paenibacillus sp. 1_12]